MEADYHALVLAKHVEFIQSRLLAFTALRFDSSEQWYRAELRVHLVQVLMEVSIQSLHVMMGETDMENQTAVLNTMALFRTLEGNMRVGSNTETLSTRRTL